MERTIYIVCKDNFKTRFLQDADMFERFKFVGAVLEAKQTSHCRLSPKTLLERCQKNDTKEFSVVGVMIPNVGSVFAPDHEVFSDGSQWSTVEDLCRAYGAPLVEPVAA